MANNNAPHGLRPLMTNSAGGAVFTVQLQKAAANANGIFTFDPIARQNGGYIGADSITPGTTLLSGVSLNYGAPSTLTTHLCIGDKDAFFEVQSDLSGSGGTASVTAAQLGQNANLTAWAAGSALPPHLSGTQISATSVATTSTLDVHLLSLYPDINNVFGNYARIEILINKHRFNGVTAGV